MQRPISKKIVPLITLLLLASIFLSSSTFSSALPIPGDPFEENDTFETAFELAPGEYPDLCQGDDDYYQIFLFENTSLKVEITFNAPMNNMDLDFLNESGFLLGESNSPISNNETLEYTATSMENITIRVYGWDNNESYHMSIQIVGGEPPLADVEPNNNLSEAGEIWPAYNSGNSQSDDDWYKIWVDNQDNLEIRLFYDNSTGILAMEMFDENETSLMNATDDKVEMENIINSQFLYFKISGPNLGQWYDLDIFRNFVTMDDWAEPNDFQNESYYISGNGYYSGLMNFDDDWFQIGPIDDGETLRVEIHYMNMTMDWLSLELYDNAGFYHGFTTWSESFGQVLEWTAGGNYSDVFLKISGYGGVPYDLNLNIWGSGGDDWMEENDDRLQAWDLPFGWTNGLVQADDDWFRVWLEPNDDLYIEHNYDWGSNSMSLSLWDQNDNHLANSYWDGMRYVVDWKNNAGYGQNVYILVSGDSNGNWYDLYVSINGMGGDDWMEENDEVWDAWDLGIPGIWWGLMNYDDDYYEISLGMNDTADIYIYCNTYASLWLELVDFETGMAYESDYSTEDGTLHLSLYSNGYYNFKFAIKGDNGGEWYDMEVKLNGASNNDDWAEENDFYDNPFHLDLGYHEGLISFDDDYYAIKLPVNTTLKVRVQCDSTNWLRLEFVDGFDGHTILSDESWEDGELILEIYADHEGEYLVGIFGTNVGSWYDIEVKTDGETDDPTKTDDVSDSENPFGEFDLSNIPGYPIEMVGGLMLVAIIAIIIPIRMKFHR